MTQIHKLSQTLYLEAMNVKCDVQHCSNQQPMLDTGNAPEQKAEPSQKWTFLY